MAGTIGDSSRAGRARIVAGAEGSMRQNTCRDCRHFTIEPLRLEEAIPGLRILSSAFGAVRADTALCDHDGTFITPMPACRHFLAKDPDRR